MRKTPKAIILVHDLDYIKVVKGGGYFVSKKDALLICDPHDFEDYLEFRKGRAIAKRVK